ncbi:MAG: flavodoxin family protein [Dehalococcoidales bacterium]|nr:flavodoxin family protein [Dehalococcoidales bacterium]
MKTLVVYDSVYGSTEKIARAIAGAVTGEVKILRASEADAADLAAVDLLIAGAPTQGGRPTPPMQEFLDKIPAKSLKNVQVATFDTRMKILIAKLFGYAAGRIADALKGKGGDLVASEGFIVKGREGPLADGETERASAWAKGIAGGKKV